MSPRQHRGSCLLRESERLKLNGDQPSPQIRFGLPERANVRLVVYDEMGREVARLVDGVMDSGFHRIPWDASAQSSRGILYRLQAGDFVQTRSMILQK